MTGMALLARAPLKVGQAIRVQASGFDAVAEVMALTRQGPRLAVHAKLLSLQVLRQSRGTLVDTQA